MHAGGRLESQVCLAGRRTVDGWRADGGGPVGLLSGETDSKHTNTQKNRRLLSMSDSLKNIISQNDL